jgi:hypothetical protein
MGRASNGEGVELELATVYLMRYAPHFVYIHIFLKKFNILTEDCIPNPKRRE